MIKSGKIKLEATVTQTEQTIPDGRESTGKHLSGCVREPMPFNDENLLAKPKQSS